MMADGHGSRGLHGSLLLVAALGRSCPRHAAPAWREQWRAELWHYAIWLSATSAA